MSAVDFRELWSAFDALEERDSIRAVGTVAALDHGPDPVRRYSPDPAVDSPAPSRSWSEPVPVLCQWCGQKPYRCMCSRGFEE